MVKKASYPTMTIDMGVAKLESRLREISHSAWQHLDAQRLAKRIEKIWESAFSISMAR
jgi:hypothetical protein